MRDAEALLISLDDVAAENSRDRAEIALLRAVGHARTGQAELAHDFLRDAYVYSVSATDLALEAEVEYYTALTDIGVGELDAARERCWIGLGAARSPQELTRTGSGVVKLEHVVSRLQELLTIIGASQGKAGEQVVHQREALATLDSCSTPDVFQEAYALRNLAVLAQDLDFEDDARSILIRVRKLDWTEELAPVEFVATEALGWCSALRGDGVEALRLFRQAGIVATSVPEQVIVGVDRALMARECGHKPMVMEEIDHAIKIARPFNWEQSAGDTRYALLSLTQATAPIAPAQAREMLDRYSAIRNSMDMSYAARIEPRVRAEEDYSHGLVLRAEGRLAASAERLQVAFETWERIGHDWRAGRAALELAELNAGDVFRLAVRRELFRRPDSIFSERARLAA